MMKYLLPLLLAFAVQVSYSQVISEIDLDNSKVEIVNNTTGTVNMTGYRWCNRSTGSPFYPNVVATDIDAANSDGTDLSMAPGDILVFQLTSAFLPAAGGELGLYLPSSAGGFGSRAAMVDYVNYGSSSGVRDSVATTSPSIWELNAAINISGAGSGDTIQLKFDEVGDSVNDYEIAAGTIGIAQFLPKLVISEIDLDNSKVEIVNNSTGTIDMTGYRWCNRSTGSPFYPNVVATDIDAANSDGTDLSMAPGDILVFQLTSAFLPAAGGELGLYLPSSAGGFGTRAAMVDYVNYGSSSGVRDSVAASAPAIWELNAAVNISGAGPGDTIQLKIGADGDSVNDYEIAAGTIGTAQLPVPELNITDFGFVDSSTLFIDYTYTGSMTVTPKETAALGSAFTAVSSRVTVSEPTANRFEFAVPTGTQYFFQLEETASP